MLETWVSVVQVVQSFHSDRGVQHQFLVVQVVASSGPATIDREQPFDPPSLSTAGLFVCGASRGMSSASGRARRLPCAIGCRGC